METETNTTLTCRGPGFGGGRISHEPIQMNMIEVSGEDGPAYQCRKCGVRVFLNDQPAIDKMLRTAHTDRNKVLHFIGEFDGTADDGDPVTYYMAYRGGTDWSVHEDTGELMGWSTEERVEASFDAYNSVELVDIADTPLSKDELQR